MSESGIFKAAVKLWNVATLEELTTLMCTNRVGWHAFAPDGSLIVDDQINKIRLADRTRPERTVTGMQNRCMTIRFVSDSRRLIGATRERMIRV
jgi:hypothetical protein